MTFKKWIIPIALSSSLLITGCNKGEDNEPKDTADKKVEANVKQEANTKNKDINKSEFIIDKSLKQTFDKTIEEDKEYNYIKNINVEGKSLSLDLIIDEGEFDEAINRINNAISLSYTLSKSDNRKLNDISIDIYYNQKITHTSTIQIEGLKNVLDKVGNGINSDVKLEMYKTFDILPFIEKVYPDKFKDITTMKKQEVEVMRNKGETDHLFTDDKLFNIDKISEQSFRKIINDKKLKMSNIHLEKTTIVGDINLDTNKDPSTEISKIIEGISVLYSFNDFEKSITDIKIYVYKEDNKKLTSYNVKVADYTNLIKSTKDKNKSVSSELSKMIDFKPLISQFKKK